MSFWDNWQFGSKGKYYYDEKTRKKLQKNGRKCLLFGCFTIAMATMLSFFFQ